MKYLFVALAVPFLFAFRFNPMSQSIDLDEGKRSVQFTVENDSAEKMAIELTVRERRLDRAGVETLPETTELTVFPPQMIILPKERRTVRVNWTGEKKLTTERAFRVIAEQLPLNVEDKKKKKTGIQMLMRYMAALYVTPEGGEPAIAAEVIASTPTQLELLIRNSGTLHQILQKPQVTLVSGSQKWALKEKDLHTPAGENVLAKSERVFLVKTTGLIPAGAKATIKFEKSHRPVARTPADRPVGPGPRSTGSLDLQGRASALRLGSAAGRSDRADPGRPAAQCGEGHSPQSSK